MAAPTIKSFSHVEPMIYAYNTPGITYHDGWIKIGYTEKQTVEQRIKQQTHTADIHYNLLWKGFAKYTDNSGISFTDHDFHDFLEFSKNVEREKGKEWFKIDKNTSRDYFDEFASRGLISSEEVKSKYTLREEQERAVTVTKEYFENGGKNFLWNAKPRFGKTLSTYDLILKMGCRNVLIVTNRPSIANSWADDFFKYVYWKNLHEFVSETPALSNRPFVISEEEYVERIIKEKDISKKKYLIGFVSLQDLKGSIYFGGEYDKLKWISGDPDKNGKPKGRRFDLLVIDEAQEGVETMRTERAFDHIARKHTLYLSGTPFKAIASDKFSSEQIFNWSYADEQEAKEKWDSEDHNPYEALPKLNMFTYQLSNMIFDKLQRGINLDDDSGTTDYAFDLNEFFATNESGKFIHEDEIRKFLHALTTQEKYPFSTPELRNELKHTMWYLNRVASARALAKLLKEEDSFFKDYEVVLAAGDGKLDEDSESKASFDKVRDAIANHDKTITLTVGQLTVGITVPEWSAVLMLCNMQSASSYMQAAFRAQNPCIFTSPDGSVYRKENAYLFDFDPARTLIIYDEFANNLIRETSEGRGSSEEREKNIKRLLNFFPVIGEDTDGKMVELDAKAVLSIPRKIKCQEVVRHGFMSNFLFANISNIFGAPNIVKDMLEKLPTAHEERIKKKINALENISNIAVDDNGNIAIPEQVVIGTAQDVFGSKIYDTLQAELPIVDLDIDDTEKDVVEKIDDMMDEVKSIVETHVVAAAAESYELKNSEQKKINKEVSGSIEKDFTKIKNDFVIESRVARAEFEKKRQSAETEEEVKKLEEEWKKTISEKIHALAESAQNAAQKVIEDKPKEVIEKIETRKAEKEKKSIEDDVRSHLRGFARTIPSFIMAYGDDNLTLANFDDYTEDDVFEEVTGITEEDFRFLRDGGDYVDEITGINEHFPGHLFDEVVFNDSIKEFLNKRKELANYFDEFQEEDIFDYIPPQRTNQIFTPRYVVSQMVSELELNNPGCFDDPNRTFADLYMKSGLYITEIVKRLFRSESMKKSIPNDNERIKHILTQQVYGMAPTRIIYLIATNYILGFDSNLKVKTDHFVEADAAEAAKNGSLSDLIRSFWGG